MVKSIAFIKRRSDLSREEFARYYEEQHAPLVVRTFPGIRRYVRNHIRRIPGDSPEEDFEFDCVTEIWFDDLETSARSVEVLATELGDAIREDEKNFIDQSRIVVFHVDTCESEI